jgi:hypothetical protein
MKAILGSAIMALAVMMGGQAPASAAAAMTGNDVYAGCVLLAYPPTSPPPAKNILAQGYCAGAVSGVAATNPSVCPPAGWITGQAVAIVLRFLDMHPERRRESFEALALEALVRMWPCQKPPQPRPKPDPLLPTASSVVNDALSHELTLQTYLRRELPGEFEKADDGTEALALQMKYLRQNRVGRSGRRGDCPTYPRRRSRAFPR